jgi:transposase InsO family protein
MESLCSWYGISRQAHYRQRERDKVQQKQAEMVLEKVQEKRQKHPRMGGRKLLHELREWLQKAGLKIGRDRFFNLLRKAGLLVRSRRRVRRTTWPGDWRCGNLLPETVIERPNQVWVSDITYIETEVGFGYLSLVTDAFSRFIVGYDFSTTLTVEGAQTALTKAITRTGGETAGVIHHSDHGIQYTCKAYREELMDHDMRCSMGQVGNCYDNALAERVNGILKQEYALGECFTNLPQAARAVDEAVWLYNYERPHLSLDYRKPYEAFYQHQNEVLLDDFFVNIFQDLTSNKFELAVCGRSSAVSRIRYELF